MNYNEVSPQSVTTITKLSTYRSTPLSKNTTGFIIVLDVSAEVSQGEASLDFNYYEVTDDFTGFKLVPSGVHYLSFGLTGKIANLWCYLQPNQIRVKALQFSSSGWQFQDALPDTIERYQNLVMNGELNEALQDYSEFADGEMPWQQITQHITPNNFAPTLEKEYSSKLFESVISSHLLNFEQSLRQTHGGDSIAFLAEFELTYLRWREEFKEESLEHWAQMLRLLCKADINDFAIASTFFSDIINILILQLEFSESRILESKKAVFSLAYNLSVNMINSKIDNIVQKGQELADYLNKLDAVHVDT